MAHIDEHSRSLLRNACLEMDLSDIRHKRKQLEFEEVLIKIALCGKERKGDRKQIFEYLSNEMMYCLYAPGNSAITYPLKVGYPYGICQSPVTIEWNGIKAIPIFSHSNRVGKRFADMRQHPNYTSWLHEGITKNIPVIINPFGNFDYLLPVDVLKKLEAMAMKVHRKRSLHGAFGEY